MAGHSGIMLSMVLILIVMIILVGFLLVVLNKCNKYPPMRYNLHNSHIKVRKGTQRNKDTFLQITKMSWFKNTKMQRHSYK